MTTDHQQIPQQLHSLKLTSPLKMVVSNKDLLFQAMSVSFREGTPMEILVNFRWSEIFGPKI